MDEWKDDWKDDPQYEWHYDPVRLRHLERNRPWRWRLYDRLRHFQQAMREAPSLLKMFWLWMLELPWQDRADDTFPHNPWFHWLVGWGWALAGLVGGALVAPSLVQELGLAGTSYADWLILAMAVLAGFLVQLVGWVFFLFIIALTSPVTGYLAKRIGNSHTLSTIVRAAHITMWFTDPITILAPLAGVSYGLYRYFTWVGTGQRSVTIAIVGGLLVKTFVIPLIKAIVTGALFKWFMRWLRNGKDTKKSG